jgi:hypothetical protein
LATSFRTHDTLWLATVPRPKGLTICVPPRPAESWAVPTLTRRRSDDPHRESWTISYDDVRVGTIGRRAGVPVNVDQWGWSCGFYPGLHPGQHRSGSAETFAAARAGFEAAWKALLPKIPEGAFDEYRRDRARRAEIAAVHARREKLLTELPNSLMRCICGVTFDSHKSAESYDHRRHIYAEQEKGLHW